MMIEITKYESKIKLENKGHVASRQGTADQQLPGAKLRISPGGPARSCARAKLGCESIVKPTRPMAMVVITARPAGALRTLTTSENIQN